MQVEAVEVVSFRLEDHSRADSGADIMHSPSIKHTRLREIQARRRFAVFLKQLCAALLFCGTDWAVVAFMVSHEQEAINVRL